MKPEVPTIHTERLILRPFTLEDIAPSYEMNLDAEVSRYTGDGGIVSLAEIERRITENVFGDYEKWGFGRFAVEVKNSPSFIGFAGLKYLPDLDEVDLGYRLMREYWGQGFATEASQACIEFGFETLGLQRIIGMVLPENAASVHILLKLGFVFEKAFMEDGDLVHLYTLQKQS